MKFYRVPAPPEKILESPGFLFLKFPGPGKSWEMNLVLESSGN